MPCTSGAQYVFGYGSLLERVSDAAAAPRSCELMSYRRTWNVAMNNGRTLPGYKHYVDATTGERHPWFVTFLNVVRDPAARVNGLLIEVDDALLERLDHRERNYERIEVSAGLSARVSGAVWAYVGSADAVRRFDLGQRMDRAVISRSYLEKVRRDFAGIGSDALRAFDALTDPPPCPILDLRRIDHPRAELRQCSA